MSEAKHIEMGPEGTSCEPNLPGVWGAGLAQRSEPERSGGERSGASPAPQTPPRDDPPEAPGTFSPRASRGGFIPRQADDSEAGDVAGRGLLERLSAAPPLSGHGPSRGRR